MEQFHRKNGSVGYSGCRVELWFCILVGVTITWRASAHSSKNHWYVIIESLVKILGTGKSVKLEVSGDV